MSTKCCDLKSSLTRSENMKKRQITQQDYLMAHRKASREEEIARHGKPVGLRPKTHCSKKTYNRKKEKAGIRKILPFPLSVAA